MVLLFPALLARAVRNRHGGGAPPWFHIIRDLIRRNACLIRVQNVTGRSAGRRQSANLFRVTPPELKCSFAQNRPAVTAGPGKGRWPGTFLVRIVEGNVLALDEESDNIVFARKFYTARVLAEIERLAQKIFFCSPDYAHRPRSIVDNLSSIKRWWWIAPRFSELPPRDHNRLWLLSRAGGCAAARLFSQVSRRIIATRCATLV